MSVLNNKELLLTFPANTKLRIYLHSTVLVIHEMTLTARAQNCLAPSGEWIANIKKLDTIQQSVRRGVSM